jgi:DNA-binding NarL/FixJ family response regulator
VTVRALRVLLCDDAAELRVLLRGELESDPAITVVGEAGDGDGAVRLAGETSPDVVVVDLEMPGPAPGELIGLLHVTVPGARLVTFSGHDPAVAVPEAAGHIALHVPKTTELEAVHRAIAGLGAADPGG